MTLIQALNVIPLRSIIDSYFDDLLPRVCDAIPSLEPISARLNDKSWQSGWKALFRSPGTVQICVTCLSPRDTFSDIFCMSNDIKFVKYVCV